MLGHVFVELALGGSLLAIGAGQALGRPASSHILPLPVREAIKVLHAATGFAGSKGVPGFPIADPVHRILPKGPEQQVGPFGRSAIEEPQWKRPQDEHVVAAADSAGCHGPKGRVHVLLRVQVQHSGGKCFALAVVSRDGKCGRQLDLRALHFQDRVVAAVVQVPVFGDGPQRVDAGLRRARELPLRICELHVDDAGQVVVLPPDPGVAKAAVDLQQGGKESCEIMRCNRAKPVPAATLRTLSHDI